MVMYWWQNNRSYPLIWNSLQNTNELMYKEMGNGGPPPPPPPPPHQNLAYKIKVCMEWKRGKEGWGDITGGNYHTQNKVGARLNDLFLFGISL